MFCIAHIILILLFLNLDARKHETSDFFEFVPLASDVSDKDDEKVTEMLVAQGSSLEGILI